MDRKQLYKEIISRGLEDAVKSTYGKNYTNCSSKDLEAIINKDKEKVAMYESKMKQNKPIAECTCHTGHDEMGASDGIKKMPLTKLIEVLQKKKILLQSEVNYITD
jgi:hypothetical protein